MHYHGRNSTKFSRISVGFIFRRGQIIFNLGAEAIAHFEIDAPPATITELR